VELSGCVRIMVTLSFVSSLVADVLELPQFPPYEFVPDSVELKLYAGEVSLVGVFTAVTSARTGLTVSMVKELTGRLSLVLLALSVTAIVQSL